MPSVLASLSGTGHVPAVGKMVEVQGFVEVDKSHGVFVDGLGKVLLPVCSKGQGIMGMAVHLMQQQRVNQFLFKVVDQGVSKAVEVLLGRAFCNHYAAIGLVAFERGRVSVEPTTDSLAVAVPAAGYFRKQPCFPTVTQGLCILWKVQGFRQERVAWGTKRFAFLVLRCLSGALALMSNTQRPWSCRMSST